MNRLARGCGALTLLLVLPSIVVAFWILPEQHDLAIGLVFGVLALASALIGFMVATRVPENSVGWILLAQGIGMGLTLAVGEYAAVGYQTGTPTTPQAVAGWWGDLLGSVVVVAPAGLLLVVFPTGRPQSRSWGALAVLFLVVVVGSGVGSLLVADTVGPGFENPFLVHGSTARFVDVFVRVTAVIAVPVALGCVASLFMRLRDAHGTERQRVKWIAFTASLGVVGFGIALALQGPVGDLAWAGGLLCVVLLPVSMGTAILRHRLFDIDLVIKRTLVYTTLTAALVSTYLVLVLILQATLRPVAGDSPLAVAASTLAVASLFRPLRATIQREVDRRFFRSQYDASLTLEAFTERLRHELDLETLAEELGVVVRQTMQPDHVSLWLRTEAPTGAVTISGRPRDTKDVP